jgi:hypothetical protein
LDYKQACQRNLYLGMFTPAYFFKYSNIAFLSSFLTSCAGLKPAQVTAIEKYSTVLKGLSASPPDIYNRVYQLRAQTQTLQLSSLIATNQSAKESIEALQLDLNDKLKFINMVDSFSAAYKIMGMYAQMLQAVVSPVYLKDFSKNKKEWETSFTVLAKTYYTTSGHLPVASPLNTSLGGITAAIIKSIGSVKIKTLQKKYLISAITAAQVSVKTICDDFITIDIPRIKSELSVLPSFINENYKDFLNNIQVYESKQGNNPYNYYKLYLPVYLNWQLELKELNTLLQQLDICFRSLRQTCSILNEYLTDNNVTNTIPGELLILENNYLLLKNTLIKFSDARDRVFKISY